MSPQHHFFLFFLKFFSPVLHPHCLLNINRCLSGGRGGEKSVRLRLFCSFYLSIYRYRHICFSFDWFVCPSVFVFLPPPFPLSPSVSGGRVRNDQSGFDAAGLCPGFLQHMSPGNYKRAPNRLLLLCHAPVWSGRKRRRRSRSKKKKRRRKKSNVRCDITPHTIFNCSAEGPFHIFLNIQYKFTCSVVIGSSLTPPLCLDWETTKKVILRTSGCCITHVVARKYLGLGWMMAPLSSAIIRQDSPEEVRNHHPIWSILPVLAEYRTGAF